MDILGFRIVRKPKVPKIERKLSLNPFFTFKTGEQLYTYNIEELGEISGRYLDQVKNTVNFMIQYNASPDQVKAFGKNIERLATEGVQLEPKAKDAKFMEIHHFASQMPKLGDYVEDLQKKMWYDLYVMFFVLEDEPETAFSPKHNKRKIELLETCTQEEQERVFFYLKATMTQFSTTYKDDTLNSLIQEGELMNLVESLINPMMRASTQSESLSMQG